MENDKKKRVDIVYTHFPHYRFPIFSALSNSNTFKFKFFFDQKLSMNGIKEGLTSDITNYRDIKTYQFMKFMFQPYVIYHSLYTKSDMVIYLGNPFIISNWIAMIILRLRKKQSMLWTHGWIKKDRFPISIIRNFFYSLSDGLLLYGKNAYNIGISNGFTKNFMHIIFNSLDYESQKSALKNRKNAKDSEGKISSYFLVVGRLVNSLEIDVLIDALVISKKEIIVKIVGDGPEKNRLKKRVRDNQLPIEFLGPIYDEKCLSKIFLDAIAVISPGKVGLLAMHALAYGIPVITHSDKSAQMPEFEALDSQVTGFFFDHKSENDLSRVINDVHNYMSVPENRNKSAKRAINTIEDRYTPLKQLEFIEQAILSVISD